MNTHYNNHDTQASLEYSAILSGLAMVGDQVQETTIENVRQVHRQQNPLATFVSLAKALKR